MAARAAFCLGPHFHPEIFDVRFCSDKEDVIVVSDGGWFRNRRQG